MTVDNRIQIMIMFLLERILKWIKIKQNMQTA